MTSINNNHKWQSPLEQGFTSLTCLLRNHKPPLVVCSHCSPFTWNCGVHEAKSCEIHGFPSPNHGCPRKKTMGGGEIHGLPLATHGVYPWLPMARQNKLPTVGPQATGRRFSWSSKRSSAEHSFPTDLWGCKSLETCWIREMGEHLKSWTIWVIYVIINGLMINIIFIIYEKVIIKYS